MAELFTIEEQIHHKGDPECPGCGEGYPEPCSCGGLVHAARGVAAAEELEPVPVTRCDQCGRSEDDLHEVA
jgi:hypothetical protein